VNLTVNLLMFDVCLSFADSKIDIKFLRPLLQVRHVTPTVHCTLTFPSITSIFVAVHFCGIEIYKGKQLLQCLHIIIIFITLSYLKQFCFSFS